MHCSNARTLKHASQGKCVLNVLVLISSLRGYRRSSYLGCVVHNKLVYWLDLCKLWSVSFSAHVI